MNVKKRTSYGKRKVTKVTKVTKSTKGTKKTGSKNILKTNYSVLVKGKMKAPSFISTLKGVSGKTRNDKLANLRRLLSTCKKKRISLLKKNGTGFKSYRTLVSQCGVTFKTPTSTSILNEKPGKLARNKGLYRILRQYDLYRGRKAMARYKSIRNTPDELMVGPLAMVPYRRPSNRFGGFWSSVVPRKPIPISAIPFPHDHIPEILNNLKMERQKLEDEAAERVEEQQKERKAYYDEKKRTEEERNLISESWRKTRRYPERSPESIARHYVKKLKYRGLLGPNSEKYKAWVAADENRERERDANWNNMMNPSNRFGLWRFTDNSEDEKDRSRAIISE
jgi:hypothetical protein